MILITSAGWSYNVHVSDGSRRWAGAVLYQWMEGEWLDWQHSDTYKNVNKIDFNITITA